MSCSCFSSSELFILAGGAGNKGKEGEARGAAGGRGRKSKMPVACGCTTRKLGLLPLLLLLARSARVRSSPRTYSAAAAVAPAAGRWGGVGRAGQEVGRRRERRPPGAPAGAKPSAAAAPRLPPRGGRRRRMRSRRGVGPAGVPCGSLLHPSSSPDPPDMAGGQTGLGAAASLETAL